MFDNIISTLNQLYNALTFKIKIAILGAIILVFITLAWFAIQNRTTVTDSGTSTPPTVINDARDLINRIGNPWQLGSSSYISNYPFLINDRVDSNIYILDINTSMLYDPYYKGLFESDSNIKESLDSKPENYTDSYQVFYNSTDNRTVNAFSRMLNFSPVDIAGQKKWFMEEGETYWLSDRNTDLTGIQEVRRSKELLPSFRKLQRIGPAKFLSTTPDPETMEMVYVTMELNNIPEAYSKAGRLSFNFLNETPATPIDPLFVGAITAETVLPTVYPLSGTKTLNKSVNTENATITFADITNVQAPTLLSDKQFNIKEYNSIFITCAPYERAKCWIYNPGLKSIVEIDSSANKKDIRATLDVDLTKLPASLKQTFDKDKLLRYNSESDELLFFYDGKWQSVLRLS